MIFLFESVLFPSDIFSWKDTEYSDCDSAQNRQDRPCAELNFSSKDLILSDSSFEMYQIEEGV